MGKSFNQDITWYQTESGVFKRGVVRYLLAFFASSLVGYVQFDVIGLKRVKVYDTEYESEY